MAYSGVTLVSILFVAVSFQLVSGIFRYHSCPFRFIPPSFRLVAVCSGTILVHSVSFRRVPVYSVPFRSVPFLCLVTPAMFVVSPSPLSFGSPCLTEDGFLGFNMQEGMVWCDLSKISFSALLS